MSTAQKTKSEPKTIEDVLAAIEAIRPLLDENAQKTEDDRRVPDANIDALVDAGAFSITVPKRFGGLELNTTDMVAAAASVAESCASTAWVLQIINGCLWMGALLPEQGQQEIWGDNPTARIAGVLNPVPDVKKVDGGFEVSGKWPFASGCHNADWSLFGFLVPDENGEIVDQGLAFVPSSEMTIEDTWHVAGMRGTGSNTIVADKVFVADHIWFSVPAAVDNEYRTELKDEALYRSSFVPLLTVVLSGAQLGMGRAALKFVLEKAQKRGITYTIFEKQKDSTAFQMEISRAATMLDTAQLHSDRACADIDRAAAAGEKLPVLIRGRIKADIVRTAQCTREAIDLLMTAHGAGAFADVSPLQRIWRDSNTGGRHAVISPLVGQEVYGRALLGVEEQVTPLI